MPYAVTSFKPAMRYENASAISSHVKTCQIYGFLMIDAILIIFPPHSAIFSASDESNPFRWSLRYPAAIFLVGFNLGATIPWIAITFVAFVNLVALTTIGIVPSRRRPVSRHVRYGSRDGKYDGFGRQADNR